MRNNKQTLMIYLKQMVMQRVVSIYKDSWSIIQDLVQCIVPLLYPLTIIRSTIHSYFYIIINYSTFILKKCNICNTARLHDSSDGRNSEHVVSLVVWLEYIDAWWHQCNNWIFWNYIVRYIWNWLIKVEWITIIFSEKSSSVVFPRENFIHWWLIFQRWFHSLVIFQWWFHSLVINFPVWFHSLVISFPMTISLIGD